MEDIKWFARTAEDLLPDRFWVQRDESQPRAAAPKVSVRDWIHRAEAAPIGRGADTLVDESVRRTLEVKAADVMAQGGKDAMAMVQWEGLDHALEHVSNVLTPGYQLQADFYKLLIYRPGDFFRSHRDSKKGSDHIITMSVICEMVSEGPPRWFPKVLQSNYPMATGGGELVFTDRREAMWNHASPGSYAAWFNTEEHEVTPLVGGYRAVLTYNVRVVGRKPPATNPEPAIDQTGSILSWLPEDAFRTLLDFCTVKDQVALCQTCKSAHHFFSQKMPLEAAFLTEQLRRRREPIVNALREGRNTTLSIFLKHEYSFDGNLEITQTHLRGSDALLMRAVKQAFPDATCSTREAFMHYKRTFSELENGGELNVVFGVNDLNENLRIVQAVTPKNVWEDPPFDAEHEDPPWRSPPLTVKSEYRNLLPPKVKRIVYWDSGSDGEGLGSYCYDPETYAYSYYWPFFRALFAVRKADRKRVFRHRNFSGRARNTDLGNEGWQTESTWYRSSCLLVNFPRLDEELEEKIASEWAEHLAELAANAEEDESFDGEEEREMCDEVDKLVLVGHHGERHWTNWVDVSE